MLILLLCGFSQASGAPLQNPEPQAPIGTTGTTLRVGVTMVTVGARITDRNGREVRRLHAEDFSILENDVPQRISFFSEEDQPVSLAILLDKSDSMGQGDKLVHAKTAAIFLEREGHPGNEFLYVPFDARAEVPSAFTTDRRSLELAIIGTSVGGGTSLYDAILAALERLSRARYPRQALVVITDGADQHSLHTLADLLAGVQASQAQVFLIGYFSPEEDLLFRTAREKVTRDDGMLIDNPRLVFSGLAEESGAASFFPRSDDELRQAVEAIVDDLRHQYTLAYYPTSSSLSQDGGYRRIQVRVRRRGVKVRARQGYRLDPQNVE